MIVFGIIVVIFVAVVTLFAAGHLAVVAFVTFTHYEIQFIIPGTNACRSFMTEFMNQPTFKHAIIDITSTIVVAIKNDIVSSFIVILFVLSKLLVLW